MHRKLGKPIIEDEEKELEPSEQDENYGKTHFSMLSHTQLYQVLVFLYSNWIKSGAKNAFKS